MSESISQDDEDMHCRGTKYAILLTEPVKKPIKEPQRQGNIIRYLYRGKRYLNKMLEQNNKDQEYPKHVVFTVCIVQIENSSQLKTIQSKNHQQS